MDQSATGPWKEVFEDATAESSDEEPPSAGTRSSGPAADNAEEVGNGDDDNDDDDDDGGAWVAIVVRTLTGSETHLRVRPDARMGGVFAEFARRWGVPDPRMFRFVYRGSVLDGDSDVTPRALGIQDGDRILAGSGARGC